MADTLTIAGRDFRLFGDPGAAFLCFQPTDEHDLSAMAEEMQAVEEALGPAAVCVAALPIRDWNTELSPWTAPPVYGKEPFGDGAEEALQGFLIGGEFFDKHYSSSLIELFFKVIQKRPFFKYYGIFAVYRINILVVFKAVTNEP